MKGGVSVPEMRRCLTCKRQRPLDAFETTQTKRCHDCETGECVICGGPVLPASDGRLTLTCRSEPCLHEVRSRAARKRNARISEMLRRRTTRVCGVCGERLPLTAEHFDIKSRDPDTGRIEWGMHKLCRRSWYQCAYALNPSYRERKRKTWREIKERRQADPEFDRAYRERALRAVHKSRARKRAQVDSPSDREYAGYLPAAPFIAWLDSAYKRFDGPWELFCEALGISERNVARMRSGEQTLISFDTVDRAVTNEGTTLLWDVYPHLAEMGAVA
jgi:hypothetical protein